MDEILTEKASDEMLARIAEIIGNLAGYTEQTKILQIMFALGSITADEQVFLSMSEKYNEVMGKVADVLMVIEPETATTADMYDILFAVQDTIPFVVEFETYLSEIGAPIKNTDDILFSDYLTEAVRV